MDDTPGPLGAPQTWIDLLTESRAEAERGDVIPLAPVLERARAAIARIEARLSPEHRPKA